MTPDDELDAFTRRVLEKIRERYDAMTEKLRRQAQDARDEEQRKERRE